MNDQKTFGKMISAEDYAKQNFAFLTKEIVIERIKSGRYIGQLVNGEWFLEPPGLAVPSDQDHNLIEVNMSVNGNYGAARNIAKFISFLGWLLVAGGVITAAVGLMSFNQGGFLAVLPGIGAAISGLFLVMAGQLTRASVDSADYNREILAILKRHYQHSELPGDTHRSGYVSPRALAKQGREPVASDW